jgi:hypothetical protein
MSKPRSSPAIEYNHVSRELRRLGTGTRGATTGLWYRPTVRGRWKIPIGRATSRIESLPAWPQWPRSPQARKPPKPPSSQRATASHWGLTGLTGLLVKDGFRSFYYSSQVPAAAAPSPSQSRPGLHAARCAAQCTPSVDAWRMTHHVKGRMRCARHRKLLLSPASPFHRLFGCPRIPRQSRR